MLNKVIFSIRILICRSINNPAFVLKIENGVVSKVSGSVKNSFIYDCIDIIQANNIKYGFVFAENRDFETPILKASFEIQKDVLQQLRNVWSFNS
jgi:hypothetical protein